VKPVFTFTGEETEQLAEEEHNRWMKEKVRRSWTHGLTRLDPDHIHDGLVPGMTSQRRRRKRTAMPSGPCR
jgi:hypothetical protein